MKLLLTTEEGYTLDQEIFEWIKGSGLRNYGNKFSIIDKNGNKVYGNQIGYGDGPAVGYTAGPFYKLKVFVLFLKMVYNSKNTINGEAKKKL